MSWQRKKGEELRLPIFSNYLMGKIVNKKPTTKLNIRLWQVLEISCGDRS